MPRRRRRLALLPLALALIAASSAPPAGAQSDKLSISQQTYLRAASVGRVKAKAWWDHRRHWYRERLGDHSKYPLATLWGVFPQFEATNAIAIADPSRAHRAAVRAFAKGARRYWNPHLRPVPGFAPYPGNRNPHDRTWFDDNGWWGIGFYDAYRATHDPSYLGAAHRALNFIDRSGWDRKRGGLWWDNRHSHKAGETLASATLLAASLYHETHVKRYLGIARKYISWADRDFRGSDGLYDRSEHNTTPMPYVQGPMFSAFALLCDATHDQSWCTKAEDLAERSAKRFPQLDMGPQYDAIYIRCLLELYRYGHNPRWYRIAAAEAQRAMLNGRNGNGLYLRNWDGGSMRAKGTKLGMLQTHAATTSVIGWMAILPPPDGD